MKKLLAILLVVSLLLVCPAPVKAAATSGQCGDHLTWTKSGSTLTISGTGPMYDYTEENPAPWASEYLYKIVIEEGVTAIGNRAFYLNTGTGSTYVFVAGSVTYIGDQAFARASGGKFVMYMYGDAPELGESVFANVNVMYAVNWDDAEKASMQLSSSIIKNVEIAYDAVNSRTHFGLNETIKPQDLAFIMQRQSDAPRYTPREVSISDYDNSTYGLKTVTITADGVTFDFTYCVTDGNNHLDLINVEFPEFPTYNNGRVVTFYPTITIGSMELVRGTHYDLTFEGVAFGTDGRVTVTGKGIAQGFEKTFYYPVLKVDLTDSSLTGYDEVFTGMPVEASFSASGVIGNKSEEYTALYANNVNKGVGSIRAVGKEYYYGEAKGTFDIRLSGETVELPGECIGTVGGELSTDIPYYEQVIVPANNSFQAKCSYITNIQAAYYLYKVDGEELTLIEEYISDVGNKYQARFEYDFSDVYEGAMAVGGEVYLLSYSWVAENNNVYAGAMVLAVPAKVAEATSVTMEHVEDDGDFRKEYFNLVGDDGVLGKVTWNSSNPSVAEIKDGTVTMKKPGTVTITGQSGDLEETYVLTVPQLDLTEGIIFDYSEAKGARVIYDNRLLTEGTDYVLSVEETGKGVTVTATGCGLFAGELMKTFDGLDSLADPHTHSFGNRFDDTCNGCDFVKGGDHDTSEKAVSHKDVIGGEEITSYYDTLEEALSVATGGTIKLLKDTTAGTAVLKPGVTLDLNGNTLTAELFAVMNGATILDGDANCASGGLLKVAKNNLILTSNNEQGIIPVWNGTDGYIFTRVTFQQMAKPAGTDAAQYIFLPTFSNAEAAALMADGSTDNELNIQVCMTWNNGQSQQFYTYSDDLVKQVFDGTGKWVFDLKVTGIAGITDMVVSPVVTTYTHAQANATGIVLATD